MKRLIFLLCILLSTPMWMSGKEVLATDIETTTTSPMELTSAPPISIVDLPVMARQLVTTYFGLHNVVACQLTHSGTRYLVRLRDKKRIFFDEEGNWLLIDCRNQNVPQILIPVKLRNQVAEKFGPYVQVVKMSRKDEKSVKVSLSNSVKMTFEI